MHGRSAEKCESTVEYILRENKLPDRSNIDYVVADFSDLKEVSCYLLRILHSVGTQKI